MVTETQLDELNTGLLELKQELLDLLAMSEESASTVSLDQTKVGRLSRMDALQQQAMAGANRVQHQQKLRQVQRALNAIEKDDYGYCESCGEDIPWRRLQAQPESVYCVTCKDKLEGS